MITERLFRPRPPDTLARWVFFVALSAFMLTLDFAGLRSVLQYERAAILAGEWYRVITGNLVHFDFEHWFTNVTGLFLVALLDTRVMSVQLLVLEGLVLCVGTSLGLLLLEPSLDWCVGLSGVQHGMIALALWPAARRGDTVQLVALIILLAKLAWEHLVGPMPWSTDNLTGVQVVTAAHTWGVVSAAIWLATLYLFKSLSFRSRN